MKTETFIEKAIEGGWEPVYSNWTFRKYSVSWIRSYLEEVGIEVAILDPKAWEAVGKVEGWSKWLGYQASMPSRRGNYHQRMHAMIDHLIAGNDIESYIKSL